MPAKKVRKKKIPLAGYYMIMQLSECLCKREVVAAAIRSVGSGSLTNFAGEKNVLKAAGVA